MLHNTHLLPSASLLALSAVGNSGAAPLYRFNSRQTSDGAAAAAAAAAAVKKERTFSSEAAGGSAAYIFVSHRPSLQEAGVNSI